MPQASDLSPGREPAALLATLAKRGMKPGLESPRNLLARLGDPQKRIPSVLIAGSNGKGSTSALLAAMLTATGYSTGLFTSPHLESVEERLRLSGEPISSRELEDLLVRILLKADADEPPTYFEALTIAAFLWYAERRADIAVLEVGLGGRLDSTNVAEPLLSVITSISLEHQVWLGDTLAEIAREKAGIFRRGRPALVWLQEEESRLAAEEVAAEVGADLRLVHREVEILGIEPLHGRGQRIRLQTPVRSYALDIALPGRHQAGNLALAVRAAEILAESGFERLGPEAIALGARRCRWPGRLEEVALPGGRRCLLDAAHNVEGAAALAEFLAEENEPIDLLFGVLSGKDAPEMVAILAPQAYKILFTGFEHSSDSPSGQPRPPEELVAYLPESFGGAVETAGDLCRALDLALADSTRTLVVCGSIYLIGEVRRLLRERLGVPPPPQVLAAG